MNTMYIINDDAVVTAELRRRGLAMPPLLAGRQSTALLRDGADLFTRSGPADPGYNWFLLPDSAAASAMAAALAARLSD